ncbi:MAG: PEGA domain-containing protein [Pseudomonadota bacterium]
MPAEEQQGAGAGAGAGASAEAGVAGRFVKAPHDTDCTGTGVNADGPTDMVAPSASAFSVVGGGATSTSHADEEEITRQRPRGGERTETERDVRGGSPVSSSGEWDQSASTIADRDPGGDSPAARPGVIERPSLQHDDPACLASGSGSGSAGSGGGSDGNAARREQNHVGAISSCLSELARAATVTMGPARPPCEGSAAPPSASIRPELPSLIEFDDETARLRRPKALDGTAPLGALAVSESGNNGDAGHDHGEGSCVTCLPDTRKHRIYEDSATGSDFSEIRTSVFRRSRAKLTSILLASGLFAAGVAVGITVAGGGRDSRSHDCTGAGVGAQQVAGTVVSPGGSSAPAVPIATAVGAVGATGGAGGVGATGDDAGVEGSPAGGTSDSATATAISSVSSVSSVASSEVRTETAGIPAPGLAAQSSPTMAVGQPPESALGADSCELKVISNPPGAMVELDGVDVGKTPVAMASAPCNRPLEVKIEKPRYEIWERRATFKQGTVNRIGATLKRPKVSLAVSSTPAGASVSIDGKDVGKTPLKTEINAFVENHVAFRLPGYKPTEQVILPKVRKPVTVSAMLEKEPKAGRQRSGAAGGTSSTTSTTTSKTGKTGKTNAEASSPSTKAKTAATPRKTPPKP